MNMELGRRIERHVVETVRKGGLEMLPESESTDGSGALNIIYRVVPGGGMAPFASTMCHVASDRVTVGIDSMPADRDSAVKMGYFILVPGTVPSGKHAQYARPTDQWAETPERLAELVLSRLRGMAPERTMPF